jgi:hypothetical protein
MVTIFPINQIIEKSRISGFVFKFLQIYPILEKDHLQWTHKKQQYMPRPKGSPNKITTEVKEHFKLLQF